MTLIRIGRYRLGPKTFLFLLAISLRILTFLILQILYSGIPLFDTSSLLIYSTSASTSAGDSGYIRGHDVPARWDSIHFVSIASKGYEYEQQLAFQPGWPTTMFLVAKGSKILKTALSSSVTSAEEIGVSDVFWAGVAVGNAAYIGATIMLYQLTSSLFPDRRYALLTSLFYLIPPTPAIPNAGYTEPLFALLTFTGLYLLIVKQHFVVASMCFAGASSIRATGILAVGVVAWTIVFQGVDLMSISLSRGLKRILVRAPRTMVPCLITIIPFLAFQWYAYVSLCSNMTKPSGLMVGTRRPWCDDRIPLAYSFVQAEYWNGGLFKYWTPAQLPNILLALPVLAVSLFGSASHLHSYFRWSPSPSDKTQSRVNAPMMSALLPLHLYSISLTLLLLFASHTQIALRVSLTDPVIWWNVTSLAADWDSTSRKKGGKPDGDGGKHSSVRLTSVGRCWVTWTVIWGSISLVLWAGHYPPA